MVLDSDLHHLSFFEQSSDPEKIGRGEEDCTCFTITKPPVKNKRLENKLSSLVHFWALLNGQPAKALYLKARDRLADLDKVGVPKTHDHDYAKLKNWV